MEPVIIFLSATVSQDCKDISIVHPSDAEWSQVYEAMTALRDHINDRIERQQQCPYRT